MSDASPDLNAILDRELGAEPATVNDVAAEVTAEITPAAPTESAAPAPATESTPAPEPVVPPEFKAEWDKRNRENQTLRARTKQYEETFGSWSEDDRGTLLALVQTMKDDPAAANEWWQANVASALKGDQGPAAQAEAQQVADAVTAATGTTPAPAPTSTGLTREELMALLDERDQKNKNEQWLGEFNKKAAEMGYDPDDADYIALTWAAANKTGTDIVEADKRVRERMMARFGADPEFKQRIIDEYIAEKAGTGDTTLPSTAGVAAPPGREPPKSVKEADKQLKEWLKEQGMSGPKDRFRE